MSGRLIASADIATATGSGRTVTASAPLLDLSQTWNNAGVTFTGLKFNVTDTASASGSLLMDLQVGGTSKFSVNKFGRVIIGDDLHANSAVSVTDNAGLFKLGASSDVVLARDAANTLALRNGTSAQALNVYNTYTDASNYERLQLEWSSNTGKLMANWAGTGSPRNLAIGTLGSSVLFLTTNNTNRWQIDTSGNFLSIADNSYDIGASGANRPRNIFVAGTVTTGGLLGGTAGYIGWSGRVVMRSPSDGVLRVANAAETQSVDLTVGASNLLTLNGGLKTTGATFALQTATTLTDNAAAQVATMTNGPAAGNPTKWIAINDNGVTRYIPAW